MPSNETNVKITDEKGAPRAPQLHKAGG